MKVQVTIDITDNARLGIGLAETGHLVPAKRTEAADFITQLVNAELSQVSARVQRGIAAIQADEQATIDGALTEDSAPLPRG